MSNSKYSLLYSPINIGRVRLKNRIVKTAAQTYFFESGEKRVGSIAKAFYGAVARGGVGLIIVETPAMEWPLAETGDRRLRVDNDKYIENISELTAEIHKHGCPVFVQFYHRGPWGGIYNTIAKRVAASPVTFPSMFDVHEEEPPHALTKSEIEELVDHYASAAVRVATAGFDGIEIHAGADHLFNTFLSPFWNKRDDMYGPQNMENRTRFLLSVIAEIKKRLGNDFPIQVFINGAEVGIERLGMNVEDCKLLAQVLEKAGVDSLHVRSHWVGMHQGSYLSDVLFYPEPHIPLKQFPKEMDWSHKGALANVPLAKAIKEAVSIPVMTVCGFDADSAEKTLRDGKADLIGFNRPIFADPEYPNKVYSNRFEDIQPCTRCGHCSSIYNEPRRCRINACFGTDNYDLTPIDTRKRVLVIGGGPAGLQVARVAALRGHDVVLWEKNRFLGGSIALAAMIKGFSVEDPCKVIEFFNTQLRKLKVEVQLNQKFDASAIAEAKPDAVILATGGEPVLPDVPGINGRNVVRSRDLRKTLNFFLSFFGPRMLRRLTRFWLPIGKRVLIIGGGIQGCQLGEFLVKRGRQVTIVETGEQIGKGLYPERRVRLFYWFDKKGVVRLSGVKLIEINKKGLEIENGDRRVFLEADNVVCALPFAPKNDLAEALKGEVPEIYTIGDCDSPGLIPDAVSAGWDLANRL